MRTDPQATNRAHVYVEPKERRRPVQDPSRQSGVIELSRREPESQVKIKLRFEPKERKAST